MYRRGEVGGEAAITDTVNSDNAAITTLSPQVTKIREIISERLIAFCTDSIQAAES